MSTTQGKANQAKLQTLSLEVDNLLSGGRWNETEFRRIVKAALEASGGDGDRLEFVLSEAEPEWLERDLAD